MTEAFLGKLRNLDAASREKLSSGASREKGLSLRTSAALPAGERDRIVRAVREAAEFEGEVEVSVDDDMSPGVELIAGGVRIGWTVDDYLGDLEKLLEAAGEEAAASRARGK